MFTSLLASLAGVYKVLIAHFSPNTSAKNTDRGDHSLQDQLAWTKCTTLRAATLPGKQLMTKAAASVSQTKHYEHLRLLRTWAAIIIRGLVQKIAVVEEKMGRKKKRAPVIFFMLTQKLRDRKGTVLYTAAYGNILITLFSIVFNLPFIKYKIFFLQGGLFWMQGLMITIIHIRRLQKGLQRDCSQSLDHKLQNYRVKQK